MTVNHYKFTGQERDSESTLDHFPARYYSSQFGRFMTPDPLGIFGADLTDPQTLNLYTYVRNNPVTLFDPTGMDFDGVDGCDPSEGCINIGFGGGGGGPEPPIDKQPPIYLPPDNGPNVNPPTGATDPNDPFSGETFGIPNGMNIPLRNLAGILLPEDTGCEFGGCIGNPWTGQAGVSVNYTFWGVNLTFFAGLAVDLHGHVAFYHNRLNRLNGGVGEGAGASGGVQFGISNSNTVCGLGGPFGNASGTAGIEGLGGTADVFHGSGPGPGGYVTGGTITLGPTVGSSASATVTNTTVIPLNGPACQ